MNLFIPRTYKVRQQILDFLSEKRKQIDQKKNDVNECAFTTTEISEQLKVKITLIDAQLDVLHKLEQVSVLRNNITENKFFINDTGFYASSSKEHLNQGNLLNSQIVSNYTNSFFQIITGIIALYTVYKSYTTIDAQNAKLEELQKSILKLEEQSKSRQILDLSLNRDTLKLNRQKTNIVDSLDK